MAIIAGTTIKWTTSPRIITVPVSVTEVTIEDLQDTLLDLEATVDGMVWPHLRELSGGESLGGGVSVGFTMELQNAQLAFAARTNRLEEGTETSGSTDGVTLTDASATFQTNGVGRGDLVFNTTDLSQATVVEVLSETSLTVDGLSGGTDDLFQSGDSYVVYDVVTCDITGGNLVAVDNADMEISPTFPTFGTQINRTASSSATQTESQDIQFASFNGGVTVDTGNITGNATSGTTFPTGTERQPCDNFTDALSVASTRGFLTIYVIGDATVNSSNDFTGYRIIGSGQNLSVITLDPSAVFDDFTVSEATITGTLDGDAHITNCTINALTYVSGVLENCLLNPATITLGGSQTAHFVNCASGVPGAGTPTIDLGGSGQPLALRNYNGGITLENKTGTESVSIDMNSGQIILDSTVTNGTIICRGVGKLTDNSVGATVVDELVDARKIIDLFRDAGLDSDSPKTITENTAGTSYDEAATGISKEVRKSGSVTTITRT